MSQRPLGSVLVLVLVAAHTVAADSTPPPPLIDKARAYLQKLDADHDGRASLLEYATQNLRDANGGAIPYKITPKTDSYWKGLDANKDGLVTPEELAKGPVGDEFRAIDTNKDGFLDANELAAAL